MEVDREMTYCGGPFLPDSGDKLTPVYMYKRVNFRHSFCLLIVSRNIDSVNLANCCRDGCSVATAVQQQFLMLYNMECY